VGIPGLVGDRYTVISADCHAGGAIDGYREYLPAALHEDFDRWRADFENPYDDLEGPDASRNWDSDRRLAELEADGIAAEVIFPNTIPPFFPQSSLVFQVPPPDAGDRMRRWEGLRAHNRWLADFCAAAPGRRAGIAQITLHDPEASAAEIRWAAGAGLTGGVLLPGAPPGSGLPPLYAPDYEPIWRACEETGLPLNHHTGSGSPDYGDYPEAKVMFLVEATWYAHRQLWQLIYAGVLERHPALRFVLTEQGTDWLPGQLATLDHFYDRMAGAGGAADGSQESEWGAELMKKLSLHPSEYWARQCYVGSSFIRRSEVAMRDLVGVGHIMWGSDFPHKEGCWPYSHEHLRLAFAGVDPSDVARMVGATAAKVYGFDLDALAPVAARIGPAVTAVDDPLPVSEIPAESLRCPAFALAAAGF